jgi:hypothetical protein
VYGAIGDPETTGDRGVAVALRHQGEHLAFPRRQGVDRVRAGPDQQLRDHLGVHDDAALGHRRSASTNWLTRLTRCGAPSAAGVVPAQGR